jgi:hypothetical protein
LTGQLAALTGEFVAWHIREKEQHDVHFDRAAINAAAVAQFEQIAERWLRRERERLPRDELITPQLVRGDGAVVQHRRRRARLVLSLSPESGLQSG